MSSGLKTALLLGAMSGLLLAVGGALAGESGLVIGLVMAVGMNAFSYWFSDKMVLRMYRAQPVDESHPLYRIVARLAQRADLPMPKVYIIPDAAANAFATGRNPEHAAIAVTTGLLHRMNRVELEGVLAHELGHVKNYDTLTSTVAAVLVGGIVIAADLGARAMFFGGMRRRDDSNGNAMAIPFLLVGILGLILAPVAARLLQLALSRQRDTLADFTAVSFTRYPPGLISALEKLREFVGRG